MSVLTSNRCQTVFWNYTVIYFIKHKSEVHFEISLNRVNKNEFEIKSLGDQIRPRGKYFNKMVFDFFEISRNSIQFVSFKILKNFHYYKIFCSCTSIKKEGNQRILQLKKLFLLNITIILKDISSSYDKLQKKIAISRYVYFGEYFLISESEHEHI